VSTLFFTLSIVLLVDPDNGFDARASRLLQLGVFLIGAGLAWIVVYTDRSPWPGDRYSSAGRRTSPINTLLTPRIHTKQ